ncbi:cytochrome P450 [Durotheca rogersii]|uniref:cytochrome P450 n=1 Tax=Durotheca rogersii TaxID=419775 RepID=UPI00221E8091|nr:cytochrome P450 [Durotheca rogersii]KAI5866012.1 cytochrome P450 [Durotheca rogersii]
MDSLKENLSKLELSKIDLSKLDISTTVYYVVAAVVLGLALGIIPLPGVRQKGLPPGPPTIPFLGNTHLLPRRGIHLWFTECARKYGPVFSLKIGSSNMVILTSGHHVTQLFDKRSLYYSNRPPSYIIGEKVFGNDHPMFMDAGDRWRHRRKLYFQLLQELKCNKDHVRIIQAETAQLLRDICLEPAGLMLHPGRFSNSVIMTLVFGIRTPRYDTSHYLKVQKIMTDLSSLGEIGSTPPVDVMPILRYLPERLWGNWKSNAEALRKDVQNTYGALVDQVLERRKTIGSLDTFVDRLYDNQAKPPLTRHEIEIMCGNLLEGGTDTMATTVLTFLQAVARNPEIQAEAQREIDSVTGSGRTPAWSDYEKLPYVNMVVKEVLRWRPPAPGAFPHLLAKDDVIDGMKIPAKSTVIVNIWGVHHDPARYKAPEVFDPSRFRGKTEPASVYANSGDYENRDHFAFGTGRRICPGIHLAERGLFVAIAKILWGFNVAPKLDANGQPIPIDISPVTGYRDGFLNQCKNFEVDVTVRSEAHRATIMAEATRAEVEVFGSYM